MYWEDLILIKYYFYLLLNKTFPDVNNCDSCLQQALIGFISQDNHLLIWKETSFAKKDVVELLQIVTHFIVHPSTLPHHPCFPSLADNFQQNKFQTVGDLVISPHECTNLDAKTLRLVMPKWRLMKWWHGDRREESRERWVDRWMKGAVWEGGGGDEERRWGGERLILWHHIGSYKLREWNPLHFTTSQKTARKGSVFGAGREEEEEKGEEEEEKSAASLQTPSLPVCVWTLTLWTRFLIRGILQWGILFPCFCLFSHQNAGTLGMYASPLFHMWWTLHR